MDGCTVSFYQPVNVVRDHDKSLLIHSSHTINQFKNQFTAQVVLTEKYFLF